MTSLNGERNGGLLRVSYFFFFDTMDITLQYPSFVTYAKVNKRNYSKVLIFLDDGREK